MKKIFQHFGIIILFFISLNSCKKDDLYYDLSDSDKELLSFEINDTFKLKNFDTDEIIDFTIISKEFDFIEVPRYGSVPIPSGPPIDTFVERVKVKFLDTSNCHNGEIYVIATEEGGFILSALLGECFLEYNDYYQYYTEFLPITSVEGIEYQNAYVLKAGPANLYYSKEKGIIKITDFEENLKFGIIE